MDNMGGLNKLYFIYADEFISLVKGLANLYTLALNNGAVITEIPFTEDTGRIQETPEETDHGTLFNFEAACRIPKCDPAYSLPEDIGTRKVLILGKDNNENYWLAGSPGSYFNFNSAKSTGENSQDINSTQLKISAALSNKAVFIVSPF